MNTQEFFDINKFRKDWGILVFPISMSRIGNTQSPQACVEALDFFLTKIELNRVGANFLYSEGLYMNFEQDAYITKNTFATTAVSHMRGVRNLVAKNHRKFQIDSAFHFSSWFQMYLSCRDFFGVFKEVERLYAVDTKFQTYIMYDARVQGKELTDRQISFYLEEHTFAYLLLNRHLTLENEFVLGREQWILLAYPGMPPLAQIYLVQKDPLGIQSSQNPYIGQYNLETKTFIPYLKVQIEDMVYP